MTISHHKDTKGSKKHEEIYIKTLCVFVGFAALWFKRRRGIKALSDGTAKTRRRQAFCESLINIFHHVRSNFYFKTSDALRLGVLVLNIPDNVYGARWIAASPCFAGYPRNDGKGEAQ